MNKEIDFVRQKKEDHKNVRTNTNRTIFKLRDREQIVCSVNNRCGK